MSGPRASRGRWVALVLLLAAAAGASSLPAGVRATGVSALAGDVAVQVGGSSAAPVVPATALVLAASGAAIALAGRAGRWVVAAIVVLSGVALPVAAGAVLADPAGPAAEAVAAQTGVDHLTGPAAATPWPWVSAAVGVLTVVTGIALLRASAAWRAPSRRHEVGAVAGPAASAVPDEGDGRGGRADSRPEGVPDQPDEREDWDALTRGADPSEGSWEAPEGPRRQEGR